MVSQKSRDKVSQSVQKSKGNQGKKGSISFAHSTPFRASGNKRSLRFSSGKNSTAGLKVSFADLFAASASRVPTLRRNQEVTGTVVAVSPQEILIDVGAKSEGIVTGRELSAVSDLVSKISIGDRVDATVVFPENDAGQVVLSLRKLSGEKRWEELEEKCDSEDEIDVVAVEVNRGGVICDYLGIRGFLPASQLSSTPAKLTELIGKSMSVRVIEVDRSSNRLILSQKGEDSRDLDRILLLLAKVNIGDILSGVVNAVLPFGVFVELTINNQKMDGLVHVSELSWEKIEDPTKHFKVGDCVEVMVVGKDEEEGKISLSIKQLLKDPFEEVAAKYSKEENVKGTVLRVTPYGVVVSLEGGYEGLIHISKIPPEVTLEIGQVVDCNVNSIDVRSRKISLVPVAKAKPILYR